MSEESFSYSDKYHDADFEYRHVTVPKELVKRMPKARLMEESEWRALGIQQSLGWQHYMIYKPEPHIVLFRRPLPKKVKKERQSERNKTMSFSEDVAGEDVMKKGRRVTRNSKA